MRPDELDPLASAAAPITPDPVLTPTDARHMSLVRRLVAQGMDRQEAIVVAARQMAGEALEPAPAPAPVMQPPQETTVSPDQIRAQGYMPQAEPGPRSVRGGGKVTPGQHFDKMSAAVDYMTRPRVLDEDVAYRSAHPDAAYQPSQRDRDMAARGFFPVDTPDGGVAYMLGTGQEPLTMQGLGRRDVPGGLGRLGPRADLEAQDQSLPGFNLGLRRGPTGSNYVYEQNEAAQQQQQAYMDERQIARFADRSGVSEAELQAMTPEERRQAVRAGQRSDSNARTDRWRAQMMLAGQNRAKNQVNAFSMMDEPGVSEDQRQSLQYMLPGGALVAQVDAAAAGQKADRNTPDGRLVDAKLAQLDREAREADPAAAGRQDLTAGNVTSPMAQKEADRLALQYDSGDEGFPMMGGYGGMSDTDEANLAAAFVRDYGMDETLARETARQAADRRRYDRAGTRNGPRGPLPVAPRDPRGGPRPAAPPPVGR